MQELDEFTTAYIECALWSTNDESTPEGGEPLDRNYCFGCIAQETLDKMIADCKAFQDKQGHLLTEKNRSTVSQWSALELAGHDFWLSRNGHGANFLDGDWADDVAQQLYNASHSFGEFDLYVEHFHSVYGKG